MRLLVLYQIKSFLLYLIGMKYLSLFLPPYVDFSHLLVWKGERVGDPMVDLVSVAESNLYLLQQLNI